MSVSTLSGERIQLTGLEKFAGKNKFPDFLFFAGGEVLAAGPNAKFKIKVVDVHGKVLKKWDETVAYIDEVPGGNMFGAHLEKDDNIDLSNVYVVVEIDTGSGSKAGVPAGGEPIQPANPAPCSVWGGYNRYTSEDGRAGCVVGVEFLF